MTRVAFAGYYGMSNFGDDLFGAAALLGCEAYWPQLSPRIVGPRIDGFSARQRQASRIPSRYYQASGLAGRALRAFASASGALSARKLVFAGGSIFHSARFGATGLACAIRAGSCSAIGVSIGPFVDTIAERHVKQLLKRFEYIAVRDGTSYEIAMDFELEGKVVRANDLAGVLPAFLDAPGPLRGGIIGFSPCSTAGKSRAFCDAFVKGAREINKHESISVCILNLNEHRVVGDGEQCAYVASELERAGIICDVVSYQSIGIESTWSLIASFSVYVTGRLHGAVTAYLAGRPFVLLDYHPKCAAFLDSIDAPDEHRWSKTDDVIYLRSQGASDSALLPVADYVRGAVSNFTEAPWAA